MAITERRMDATPGQIFEALLDPYLYRFWVVGAKSIRGADDNWPNVGSAFYHRFGAGEAHVKDKTEVLALDPPHRIALRTYARPFGIAVVKISVRPSEEGGSVVALFEEPEEGTRVKKIERLIDPVVHARNIESLRRLERVVRIITDHGRDRDAAIAG